MPHWLDELNPAQREAATHGDGPLLIVAGAGTGKTKTLACRVAWLIEHGVSPERILLLTFTRRAAAEMVARAGHLTGAQTTGKVWGGTFHALGNRLLRLYGRAIGLAADFTVADQADAADLMNLIRSELGLAKGEKRFPRKETLIAIYSRTVNAECKLSATLKTHFPWCAEHEEALRQIFQLYTQRKREQNVLDYDDLLLYWAALADSEELGNVVEQRFDHVLVDEYQDTNAVQSRILRACRKQNHNLCVVGDDAQSIYSFRAATVRNILDFPEQFPGTRVVTLEQNYRSTQPILAASNAVMERATERFTKNLWSHRESGQKPLLITCMDEQEQCTEICRAILAHLEEGIPLRRQAVLFRTGYHSDMLEVELARRHIPFHKYGGLKFVEAAHVKDLLAFLRVLENPHDEISWFRILQLLEGVGPAAARRIMTALGVRRDHDTPTSLSPLRLLFENPPSVPATARKQFDDLRLTLAECTGFPLKIPGKRKRGGAGKTSPPAEPAEQTPAPSATRASVAAEAVPGSVAAGLRTGRSPRQSGGTDDQEPAREPVPPASPAPPDELETLETARAGEPPPAVQVERIRRCYQPLFEKRYDNPTIRLRDLEQLEQIAAGYRSRARFITDLTLDPPASTSDLAGPPFLEEDYLILSTIHSAKGCEWDAVYVIHAADGNIPSDMSTTDQASIDEERRLFYVALTRAKDHLYVLFPLRYYRARMGRTDTHHYAQLTRFLAEGPKTLFEQRPAAGFLRAQERPVEATKKVDDMLKGLWE